jgi:putative transcription factor
VRKLRCEACGCRINGQPFRVIIEGARLTVCTQCAKHGKIVYDEPKPAPMFVKPKTTRIMVKAHPKPKAPTVDTSLELAEDFGAKIRKAREQLGLSHDELGKRLNEKVSLLRKIETGKMAPDDKLAAALEHLLKVKLIVPAKEAKVPEAKIPKKTPQELTLGDLIQIKKKAKDGEGTAERKRS